MTPGHALNNLRQALAAHDVSTVGMIITRLAGTLYRNEAPLSATTAACFGGPLGDGTAAGPSALSTTPETQPAQHEGSPAHRRPDG
jgi:hypothetical protein